MMLGIGVLILHLKTNVLVSADLNVGHVSRSEDKKRVTLFGVEREYCLPDVALCGVLNLLVAANIQCAVHRLAFGGMVVNVVCLPQPVRRQSRQSKVESRGA